MAFNVLSGTINALDLVASGSFSGSYIGDGSGLENVQQFQLQNAADQRVLFYKLVNGKFAINSNSGFSFAPTTGMLTIPNSTASAGFNLANVPTGSPGGPGSYLAIDSSKNIILTSSLGSGGGSGGISYSRRFISAHATASTSDTLIGISASSPLELRLPSAGGYTAGQYFTVKDEAGNCNTFNITILTTGAQTIDGFQSVILESPFAAVNIYADGTSKFFIY
jgi:hypothetical protein